MISRPVTNCYRIFLLFLAALLLLPVYGSWIDHRYPVNQPGHKHIYLGKVDLDHHRTAETKNIVILPDQDATSQPVVLAVLPDQQLTANTADPDNLTFGFPDQYYNRENAFLPPPDHPPRL